MKTSVGLVLAAVGICLGAGSAEAAGKYDGSVPLHCVPTAVTECGAEGECRQGKPESINLPHVLRVDVKALKVHSEDTGRESPIKTVERLDGKMVLQGTQGERGWTLMVSEKTGKMSGTITADGEGFIVFGVCTTP
jgi:hypothetical protein